MCSVQCTEPVRRFIWRPPGRPVLGHRLNRCNWFLQAVVQFIVAFMDTSKIYYLYFFTTVECLSGELDASLRWIGHIEFYPWDLKKSYKCDLTNLLVLLIMLSYNHQNHKQWPNEIMFLTSVMWDDAANSTHAVAKVTSLISTTYFWHSPTMEWVALDMTN